MTKLNLIPILLACSVLLLIMMNVTSLIAVTENAISMDYNIFSKSIDIMNDGKNPYNNTNIVEYTGHPFPFRYPPITLLFFKLITPFHHFIVWSILLVLITLIIMLQDKTNNMFLFITILTTAYMTTYKNFTIGNIGLVDVLIYSFIFWFIIKKRYYKAAILIGFAALFKIVPIVYVVGLFFIPISFMQRLRLVLLETDTR